jgi:hypothetical protein
MPNLKRVPGVTAKKPKRGRGRRARSKHRVSIGDWWRVIRFAMIVKRARNRRQSSSPSVRQVVLIVVSGGLAIVIIRGFARRTAAAKRARSTDGDIPDQTPAPGPPSEPTTPGAQDALTERVRAEMFENKN